MRNNKGFTFPEVSIAATIMALVIIGAVVVFTMSYNVWKNSLVTISLQQDGNVAMERMVRGMQGPGEVKKHGLREAASYIIPIPGGSVIRFVSGIDAMERSFFLAGNRLMYDPDTSVAGNEIIAAEQINTLIFEALSVRRIRVNVTLQGQAGTKTIITGLTTEATIRN